MSVNENGSQHQRDAQTIWNTAPKTEAGFRAAIREHAALPDAHERDFIYVQRAANTWSFGWLRGADIVLEDELYPFRKARFAARRAERESQK
jgi:hypothetical protein